MSDKLPCEVIQDLLPLYVDELTQDVTGHLIGEHLKECESCNSKYHNMINKLGKDAANEDSTIPEIDYLKKVRQKNRKKIVLSSLLTLAVLLLAAAVKLFIIGSPVAEYSTKIEITEQKAVINGDIRDSIHVYSHYQIKDDTIIVYGCLPSFWNHNGSFQVNYDLSRGDISVGGSMIKSDGQIISAKALALYQAKNPYLGDMSANNRAANALGISSELGRYLNSLQTTKQPYGWTLEFQDEVLSGNQVKFDSTMEAYACVLLAMIDNCGEVSWTYTCNGRTYIKTFTSEDARVKIGSEIKNYSSSPEKVQELLNLLNIK